VTNSVGVSNCSVLALQGCVFQIHKASSTTKNALLHLGTREHETSHASRVTWRKSRSRCQQVNDTWRNQFVRLRLMRSND
jgi:uncharacterized lipoprotein NlpE involved in copper resistance